MRHISQQEIILRKIREWLTPGGQLAIFDFFRPKSIIARFFHNTAGRTLLPLAGALLGGFGPAYIHLHASIAGFSSRREYEDLFVNQGFEIQRSEDLTFGIVSFIIAKPLAGEDKI